MQLVTCSCLSFFLVPGQPQNLQQIVLSSSSASLQWQAPPITNPHNLLLMYTLLLLEEQFGLPSISLNVNSSITSYTFTQLEEFNTYTCSIYPVNEVGTGLPSSVSFTTQEDGMYLYNIMTQHGTFNISLMLFNDMLYNIITKSM